MVASGYGPRTAWHGCTLIVWSNNSQDSTGIPSHARTGIVRALHGHLQCFSYRTGPVWDTQGCRTTPLRTRKWIDTSRIGKNPARASYLAEQGPYGPLTTPARAVHGLFTISKPVRGPVAYNALKLYGPHGACVGTWVDVMWLGHKRRGWWWWWWWWGGGGVGGWWWGGGGGGGGPPLCWLVIGDGNTKSVYNDTNPYVSWTEIESHPIEKIIRKAAWKSKI